MDSVSVFKNPAGESAFLNAYDRVFDHWPVPCQPKTVPTRFGRTHINVSGPPAAPSLLLLPGNYTSSTIWRSNIADLSKAHRVYAVDTLGDVGKSVPDRMPVRRADYADWISDLFAGLDIMKADILGMSYGGFLAVNYALQFPDRVRRLVLLCPGLPLAPFTIHWMIRGLPMLLSSSRRAPEWFLAGASVEGYDRGDPVQEAFVTGVAALRSKSVMRPVIDDSEWRTLRMPVLFLVGDREILYDPNAAVRRIKQLAPQIQAELVPHAGHLVNCDQPEYDGKSVLRFLEAGE